MAQTRTAERTAGVDVREPQAANIAVAENATVKVVEFGKLPGEVQLRGGETIRDLIESGYLHNGLDYYVNGNLVNADYTLQPGDAVVGAPRLAGGVN